MKRIVSLILCFVMPLGLCACGGNTAEKWQEQYDLGVRYLSEGNYEEAIIAFELAIEIDPKQPDAYLKAAEAYMAMGDTEKARTILERGFAETEDNRITEYLTASTAPSWSTLSAEQQTLFRDLETAIQAFDCATTLTLMSSDEFLSLWKDLEIPGGRTFEAGDCFDVTSDDGIKYTVNRWDGFDELDYWFYIHGENEYWSAMRWTHPDEWDYNDNQLRISHMSGTVNNENGPYKQIETTSYGDPAFIIEGTAQDGQEYVSTKTEIR